MKKAGPQRESFRASNATKSGVASHARWYLKNLLVGLELVETWKEMRQFLSLNDVNDEKVKERQARKRVGQRLII